jgi:hypothetical protein
VEHRSDEESPPLWEGFPFGLPAVLDGLALGGGTGALTVRAVVLRRSGGGRTEATHRGGVLGVGDGAELGGLGGSHVSLLRFFGRLFLPDGSTVPQVQAYVSTPQENFFLKVDWDQTEEGFQRRYPSSESVAAVGHHFSSCMLTLRCPSCSSWLYEEVQRTPAYFGCGARQTAMLVTIMFSCGSSGGCSSLMSTAYHDSGHACQLHRRTFSWELTRMRLKKTKRVRSCAETRT